MNVVYKTIPKHTDEKIPLDQIIEIYFMIDINKNTIRPEGVILLNLTEQTVEPTTFEYNRRILKISTVNSLKPNNHYQLQLLGGTDGLKDITGRAMEETYEVEFYTKDVESIKPPKILSPTDVSVVRAAATFQLEPNLDADYYELQISTSNTFQNLVWPTNGEKVYRTPEVLVTPDVLYQTGLYFMRVRSIGFDRAVSSWSPTIRYFYDGAPIIYVPEEPSMPDETEIVTPQEPATGENGDVVTQSTRRIVLTAMSQMKEPDQLSVLQNNFMAKASDVLTGLYVKSVSPKDHSVNNPLAILNSTNKKQIVIEFTKDIDPASITKDTCYVLSERN